MKKWCLLLVALIFSGCAHTNTEQAKQAAPAVKQEKAELSAALVAETIVKGKTTREEIVAKFGPPNSVDKNTRLPSKEMLAKAKGPLPPIARTVEFWNYWTVPPTQELEKSAATGAKADVFRLMIFIDEKGVAVDYITEERKVDFTQPGN
ncbi:MAG TPA: hypothetical protein VEM32_07180 [Geobacteraceae bacterium]|nr:hypothetical protein [Geobacteraceae bacterium]